MRVIVLIDREEGEMVFLSGGALIRHTIQNGDSLELRSGDQCVLVKDVAVQGDDKYFGTIYSIEPSGVNEINGLKGGDAVQFRERNVFGIVAA